MPFKGNCYATQLHPRDSCEEEYDELKAVHLRCGTPTVQDIPPDHPQPGRMQAPYATGLTRSQTLPAFPSPPYSLGVFGGHNLGDRTFPLSGDRLSWKPSPHNLHARSARPGVPAQALNSISTPEQSTFGLYRFAAKGSGNARHAADVAVQTELNPSHERDFPRAPATSPQSSAPLDASSNSRSSVDARTPSDIEDPDIIEVKPAIATGDDARDSVKSEGARYIIPCDFDDQDVEEIPHPSELTHGMAGAIHPDVQSASQRKGTQTSCDRAQLKRKVPRLVITTDAPPQRKRRAGVNTPAKAKIPKNSPLPPGPPVVAVDKWADDSCFIPGCDGRLGFTKGTAQKHIRRHFPTKKGKSKGSEGAKLYTGQDEVYCAYSTSGVTCGKKLALGQYGRHLISKHIGGLVYPCPECNDFDNQTRRDATLRHVRSVHGHEPIKLARAKRAPARDSDDMSEIMEPPSPPSPAMTECHDEASSASESEYECESEEGVSDEESTTSNDADLHEFLSWSAKGVSRHSLPADEPMDIHSAPDVKMEEVEAPMDALSDERHEYIPKTLPPIDTGNEHDSMEVDSEVDELADDDDLYERSNNDVLQDNVPVYRHGSMTVKKTDHAWK